jgi:kinesin family member 11
LQVSEYIGQLNEKYSEEKKHLKLEMSILQQVSDKGKEEVVAYAGMVESQLQEDNSSHIYIYIYEMATYSWLAG